MPLVEGEAFPQVEENHLPAFSFMPFDRPVERTFHNVSDLPVSLVAIAQALDFLVGEWEILAALNNRRKYWVK